jgi:drug/metabolite transporter (DMT)-like permease
VGQRRAASAPPEPAGNRYFQRMRPGLAIVLALASAACYAISAALQHREASQQQAGGVRLMAALVRRKLWWGAVTATLAGGILHLSALNAGPLVLVQPLGVMALVFALPVGARLAGTPVTRRAWTGALCVVVGLPCTLSAISRHPAVARAASSYPTAAAVIGLIAGAAALAAILTGRSRPPVTTVLYAVAAALCFGLTSGTAKTILLGFGTPAILMAGLAAIGLGIVLAQHAYRDGGLGAPFAVLTLADPLTAATVGVVVLGEPLVASPLRLAVGAAGVAITCIGVVLLTPHPVAPAERAAPVPGPST